MDYLKTEHATLLPFHSVHCTLQSYISSYDAPKSAKYQRVSCQCAGCNGARVNLIVVSIMQRLYYILLEYSYSYVLLCTTFYC